MNGRRGEGGLLAEYRRGEGREDVEERWLGDGASECRGDEGWAKGRGEVAGEDDEVATAADMEQRVKIGARPGGVSAAGTRSRRLRHSRGAS